MLKIFPNAPFNPFICWFCCHLRSGIWVISEIDGQPRGFLSVLPWDRILWQLNLGLFFSVYGQISYLKILWVLYSMEFQLPAIMFRITPSFYRFLQGELLDLIFWIFSFSFIWNCLFYWRICFLSSWASLGSPNGSWLCCSMLSTGF